VDVDYHKARVGLTQLAKKDLLAFVLANDPKYQVAKVHAFLLNLLQETIGTEGEKRIVINMPPQHGKSRAVCEEFVSFLLGKDPTENVALAGYGLDLPTKNCKRLRERVKSDIFKKIFPDTQLSEDTQTQTNWTTTKGGGVKAVGIGSGLTGNRVSTLIIDDPHKDRQEAESATYRNRIWDWFTSTAMTRLTPNSTIILIMTRWHEDDLCGRLTNESYVSDLTERGFEDQVFTQFNFPAICEEEEDLLGRVYGEALWEENKPVHFLEGRRQVLGQYEYNALYRGNPIQRGGNIVDIEKIDFIDRHQVPQNIELVRAWDLAATSKETSDFSASAQGGYDKENDIFYLCHITRKRMNWHSTKQSINKYGDMERNRIGIETVGGFITAYEQIRIERRGKNLVQNINVSKDKLTRANGWLSLIDAGRVKMVRGNWNYEFLDELRAFPDAKHDDQVDAVSLAFEMVYKKGTKLLIA
jgi:predicted phage terminase large subunit-like protein